jgi:hypothetical protein
MASFFARSPQAVAKDYVGSRSKSRLISTSQALRAIRTALPHCSLDDRELEDLVAAAAIEAGFNIHFDLDENAVLTPLWKNKSKPLELREETSSTSSAQS